MLPRIWEEGPNEHFQCFGKWNLVLHV